MIPGYASVYQRLESHFFQTTSRYDGTFVTQRRNVEELLGELLKRWITLFAPSEYMDIVVSDPKIDTSDDNILHFNVLLMSATRQYANGLWETTSSPWTLQMLPMNFNVGKTTGWLEFRATHVPRLLVTKLPDFNGIHHESDTHWGQDMRGEVLQIASDGTATLHGEIVLSGATYREIDRLRHAELGQTIVTGGSYLRFVYFSAMTQTTVGYGDIVPITDVARGWVTSQAILGIVFAGLFLNAIAARAAYANAP